MDTFNKVVILSSEISSLDIFIFLLTISICVLVFSKLIRWKLKKRIGWAGEYIDGTLMLEDPKVDKIMDTWADIDSRDEEGKLKFFTLEYFVSLVYKVSFTIILFCLVSVLIPEFLVREKFAYFQDFETVSKLESFAENYREEKKLNVQNKKASIKNNSKKISKKPLRTKSKKDISKKRNKKNNISSSEKQKLFKAVLLKESEGDFFDKLGRIKIRYERHRAYEEYVRKYGKSKADKLARKFPKYIWPERDNSNVISWKVFNKAKKIVGETIAHNNTSYGAPQIMGFNHKVVGYINAKAMKRAFQKSADAQMQAFEKFLEDYEEGTALTALLKKDFMKFAEIYNGSSGKRQKSYARRLKKRLASIWCL